MGAVTPDTNGLGFSGRRNSGRGDSGPGTSARGISEPGSSGPGVSSSGIPGPGVAPRTGHLSNRWRLARSGPSRHLTLGLLFAGASAVAFSLSGVFASGLLDTGWSPGAMVLVRVAIATLVVLPLGIVSLRGDWRPVRKNLGLIAVYGAVSVAGCQFAYFSAVQHMPVGPALLIEYTAPAAVVLWFWLRHGQRPTRATIGGTLLAAVGLVLVLNLISGAPGANAVDPVGIAWALVAMLGVSTYFVINANVNTGLPPLALAAGGLTTATVALGVLGATGLMPLEYSTAPPVYAGTAVPWWLPVLGLGIITAGFAYVAGIAAGRLLGPRLSSFVGLFEVVSAIGFAWLLLGELPQPIQLLGGALILAGVIAVQAGEKHVDASPVSAGPASLVPADAVAASAAPADADLASAGPASAVPAPAGPTNVGPANVGPTNVGHTNVGPAEAGPGSAVLTSAASTGTAPGAARPADDLLADDRPAGDQPASDQQTGITPTNAR